MRNKKLIRIIQLVIFLLVVGYLSKIIYQFVTSFTEGNKVSNKPNKEYISLFSREYRNQIHAHNNYSSKVRYDISSFDFDKKYSIVIFKLPLSSDFALNKTIVENNADLQDPKEDVYLNVGQEKFDLKYKSGNPGLVSEIFVALEGGQFDTVIKNDSIASYSFSFNKLSLKYLPDQKADVYANSYNQDLIKENQIPANLLFLKKSKFVYVFIMASSNVKFPIDRSLIYQLITGKRL
jgi:hypothetical protein